MRVCGLCYCRWSARCGQIFITFRAALGVRLLEQVNLFKYGSGSVGFYDRYLFPVSRQLDRLLKGGIGKNLVAIARRAG
jgi:hypothetical protein